MSINVLPNSMPTNLNLADLGLTDLATPNQKPQVDANGKIISPLNFKKQNQKGPATLNEFDAELLKNIGQAESEVQVSSEVVPAKNIDANILNKKTQTPTQNKPSGLNIESILGNHKAETKKEPVKKDEQEKINDVQLKNIISPQVAEAPKVKTQVQVQAQTQIATNPQLKTNTPIQNNQKATIKETPSTLVNILNKKTEEQSDQKPFSKVSSSLNTVLENKTESPVVQTKLVAKNPEQPLNTILEKNIDTSSTVKTSTPKEVKTLESLFKEKTTTQDMFSTKSTPSGDLAQKISSDLPQVDKAVIENNFKVHQEPKTKTFVQPEVLAGNTEHKAVYDLNEKLSNSVQEFNKNYAYNSYSKNYGGEAVKKSAINYEPAKMTSEPILRENKNQDINTQDNVIMFNRNLQQESNHKNNLDNSNFTQATNVESNSTQNVSKGQQSIIDNITNYIAQNSKTNKDEIQFKIKDESGGNISINIKKSHANENLNIQISVDNPEIREMLTNNNRDLLTQLNNSGIKVQSFKIDGQNSFSMRNDSSDSSSSFSQSQRGSSEFQQSSSGQADKREDSSRRQHLWDMYRERMSA